MPTSCRRGGDHVILILFHVIRRSWYNDRVTFRRLMVVEVYYSPLNSMSAGKNAVFTWRGKPLFIRHRTSEEISASKTADVSQLRDPQSDEER